MQHRHVDEFGGRVEMAERSAKRAAVARLAMADVREGFAEDRKHGSDFGGKFEVALPRHRADREPVRLQSWNTRLDDLLRSMRWSGIANTRKFIIGISDCPPASGIRVLERAEKPTASAIVRGSWYVNGAGFNCIANPAPSGRGVSGLRSPSRWRAAFRCRFSSHRRAPRAARPGVPDARSSRRARSRATAASA